jgi:hypothetical protein
MNKLIEVIITGGLLGMLGQGIRIIVGIKKIQEQNAVAALSLAAPTELQNSRIIYSLFIGFVAGALGLLVEKNPESLFKMENNEMIVMLIAIGYAGADFIEGIFKKYMPQTTTNNPNGSNPPNTSSTVNANTDFELDRNIQDP